MAKTIFQDWNKTNNVRPVDENLVLSSGNIELKLPTQNPQVQLNYFHPCLSLEEDITFSVISNFLSYGFSAHLKTKLRHEKGLIYGISLHEIMYRELGVVQISTESSKPEEVIALIKSEIKDLPKLLTPKIIEKHKVRLTNVWLRSMSSAGYTNGLILGNMVYHGELVTPEKVLDILKTVDIGQINNVLKKVFNENTLWVGTAVKE